MTRAHDEAPERLNATVSAGAVWRLRGGPGESKPREENDRWLPGSFLHS